MNWRPDKDRPLCPQIYERICVQIALGNLPPDTRLPSVRESAMELGINPNTVQRAMELLERDGMIYSVRGMGWYIADNREVALHTLAAHRRQRAEQYFTDMMNLGLDRAEATEFIKEMSDNVSFGNPSSD